MLKINKEKKMANKIKKVLQMRGFIVTMQLSKKTNSVYLKIDNGATEGIRISDHVNKITKYKFNVIRNYQGKRAEFTNGKYRIFYNYNSLGRLIADLETERANNIFKNGYNNYKKIRERQNDITVFNYNTKVA